jgi:hypothetical protein
VATCTSEFAYQSGNKPTFDIKYDTLVVSVGEQPATYNVPGVYEHWCAHSAPSSISRVSIERQSSHPPQEVVACLAALTIATLKAMSYEMCVGGLCSFFMKEVRTSGNDSVPWFAERGAVHNCS